jgi:Fe-S-cluster-containing hydrogenase component 2
MVGIDDELCIKCQECLTACPYKAIFFDGIDDKVIKCDLCGGDPKCVRFCETRAIEFLEKDSAALQKKRDPLQELERLLKLTEEC